MQGNNGIPNMGLSRLDHLEANSRRENFVLIHQQSLFGVVPWDKSCLYRMGIKTLATIGCPPEDQSFDHITKCQFCLIWDRYSKGIRMRQHSQTNCIFAPVNNTGLPDIYLIRSFPVGSINPVNVKVGKFDLNTITPVELETKLLHMVDPKSVFHLFGRFICGDQATIVICRPNYSLNKCYLDIKEIFESADVTTILGMWVQLIRWVQYLEHLGMFGQYNIDKFGAIEMPYYDQDFRTDSLDQINNQSISIQSGNPICRFTIFPKDLSNISLLEPGIGCACNSDSDTSERYVIPNNLLPLITSGNIGSHTLQDSHITWSDHLYLQSCLLLGDKSIKGYLNAIILLSQSTGSINPIIKSTLKERLQILPIIYSNGPSYPSLLDYQGIKVTTFKNMITSIMPYHSSNNL